MDNIRIHPSPLVMRDYTYQGGNLHCRTCDDEPIWCEHLNLGTIRGDEFRIIWPNESERYEQFILQIPIFPTDHLWETVVVHPVENYFRYRVGWWPDHETQPSTESTFLMYLNYPESRKVIRDVLLEQLYAEPNFHKVECESSAHGFAAQMNWQQSFKGNQNSWPELWAVFRYKKCLTCLKNQFDPSDHPDLFPSKENSGVWT